MSEKYTVDYFIEKFTAIPEELWCKGEFVHGDGRRCAYGHCGISGAEPNALANLINSDSGTVIDINDGTADGYQQSTPRARILAALQDIKAKSNKGEL